MILRTSSSFLTGRFVISSHSNRGRSGHHTRTYVTSSTPAIAPCPGGNNFALVQVISNVTSPENSSPFAFIYSLDVHLAVCLRIHGKRRFWVPLISTLRS